MNSEERDIINGIFQRLEQASNQPRDADAERFIADKLRAQPYAPYAMAQLVYVQEEAIKSLNQQLEEARRTSAQPAPGQGGGFLSSIFGGGARPEPQRPAGQPWGNQGGQPGYGGPQGGYPPQGGYGGPQPGYGGQPQGGPWGGQAPARGGGFLASALPMAAGAAGGMLLGSALSNAFAGGHSHLGSAAAAGLGGGGDTIVENNYYGSGGGNDDLGAALDNSPQGASFGDDSGGDFGGDLGSGNDDDWA